MLRNFFRYFHLSRTEQNGFFVLCLLIVFSIAIPYLYKRLRPTNFHTLEVQTFAQETIAQKPALNSEKTRNWSNVKHPPVAETKADFPIRPFDPNQLDAEGWQNVGLSDKQAQVILNYRAKGGKFYKKEDLAKIYSISATQFKRLQDFIVIDQDLLHNKGEGQTQHPPVKEKKKNEFAQVTKLLDINAADTTSWMAFTGIGTVFAKRIINYRQALGGFVSVQQIKEIYGLPEETYEGIFPYLTIAPGSTVSLLHLNELDAKTLSKHPYVNFKQANAIINYRIQHGQFKQIDDLRKIILLDDDFLRKLAPYLTF